MPSIVKEGNFIYFGVYPQDRKAEDVRLLSQNERGYYIGTDGYQYFAVRNKGSEQFGQAADSLSYYRVMPIKWRIIGDKIKGADRCITLLSEVVLDAAPFQPDVEQKRNKFTTTVGDDIFEANDWEGSFIRRWLSSEFAARAFEGDLATYITRNIILTDGYRTLDRIYLPSRRVAKAYRIVDCAVSDFALSRGADCGDIWLREMGSHSGNAAYVPQGKENGKTANVGEAKGVLPIINILVQ